MSKELTKKQESELAKWENAFTEEEVFDGFVCELGFFGSFHATIKNEHGNFQALVGDNIDQEFGKTISVIPIYSFISRKLSVGITKGLDNDKFDSWSDEDKKNLAVTYGSVKQGDDDFSYGSFNTEKLKMFIENSELGRALTKRLYVVCLMPNIYGMKLCYLTFGSTAIKSWSSYVKLLSSEKMVPIACVSRVTLTPDINKKKQKYHRPIFEVLTKNNLPVRSADSPDDVRKIYYPIRYEIKAAHIDLCKRMERVEPDETDDIEQKSKKQKSNANQKSNAK